MGLWEDVKAWLRREEREAREWVEEAAADGHAELDRAERRISADPDERLAATLDDIAEGDDAFEALRAKAEAAGTRPAAEAEVAEAGSAEADGADVRRDADAGRDEGAGSS